MASANTLTGLIPTIYEALDTVSRELVGFIPSVFRNSDAAKAAKDETITYPVVPAMASSDITPAATGPDPSGNTYGTGSMTISKAKSVPFPWNGEEELSMRNGKLLYPILADSFAQSLRTLVNEIETDLGALYVNASRAYGTAGTTPFASTLADTANIKKILDDNGAPPSNRRLVINTTAGAKMRTLGQLTKANEASDNMLLRQGLLLDVHGQIIRESAQISTVTKGTGSNYVTNTGTTYPVGTTSVAIDTGSGTVLAGDVVTFAGDANKYVVKTGVTGAGTIVLQEPGLKQTLADGVAMTIGGDYVPNMGFSENAIHLVTRTPAMPQGGDSAVDEKIITDPRSGLSFRVAKYAQYHQVSYEVGIAWGVAAVKPEHIAILLG